MPFIRKVRVLCKTRLIFPRINGPIVKDVSPKRLLRDSGAPYLRKFGHDVSVRPNADRTDSGGGRGKSGVS